MGRLRATDLQGPTAAQVWIKHQTQQKMNRHRSYPHWGYETYWSCAADSSTGGRAPRAPSAPDTRPTAEPTEQYC